MNLNTERLLEGKRCVITSGAHGLGFAIAQLFASQGAAVAICGRRESGFQSAKILQEKSPKSFFYPCDLSDPEQVEAFGKEVLCRFGQVDVLVNNAGINEKQLIVDMDREVFEKIQQVNLRASIQLIQLFVPVMIKEGICGSIIHISSMNALAPSPTTGAYVVSKGGVNALSNVLACEVGKYGIRSNVICAGWIATTYIQKDVEQALQKGGMAEEVLEAYHETSPLYAPARPWDIAGHALFLASEMSSYLTGCILHSDGGAVLQAHACEFEEPEDAKSLRNQYYQTILEDPSWCVK